MADISLRIKADFNEASRQFNALAETSEYAQKQIERFAKSFTDKKLNEFIDKQKIAANAITVTKGSLAAAEAQNAAYLREIERLIKSGLNPNSDAVQRLANEQKKLETEIKKATDAQKIQKDLMKVAEKAALACFAAIGAGAAAMAAITQKTAEAGDAAAKASRIVGMTAETLQELQYAAKQSGVSDLTPSLKKLNKTIADVKNGSGSLTNVLENNNKELLAQLKYASSNEQAFNLLINAIKDAPDEFTRAEIATAAFGKAGQDLIIMAENGTEGLSALREEARKYGVISNEAAKASEEYMDAQGRLKAAISGVSTQLTAGVMPGITKVVNGIASFISSVDDWEKILKIAGYTLAAVTAGLTAFLVVAKGKAIIDGLKLAFEGLTQAIAKNPLGTIAVVVTAVLIPALIALYRNWDVVSTYLIQGAARVEYAFNWLASQIKEKLTIAFNAIKIAGSVLLDFIIGNIVRGVGDMLKVMGKLPFVGSLFDDASTHVQALGNAIRGVAEESNRNSRDAIENAKEEQNTIEATLKSKLEAADMAAIASRAALNAAKAANDDELESETMTAIYIASARIDAAKAANTAIEKSLRDRLNATGKTEAQAEAERLGEFNQFLKSRLDAENLSGNARIEYLKSQAKALADMETLSADERLSAQRAVNALIIEEERALLEERKQMFQDTFNDMLGALNNFLDASLNIQKTSLDERLKTFDNNAKKELDVENLTAEQKKEIEMRLQKERQKIIDDANRRAHSAAIAQRTIASAEAVVQTYLAASKALASGPPPANFIAMAATIAAGLGNVLKINSTPIPKLSAETGGSFIVPNLSPRVDGVNFSARLNGDERVKIEPRGEHGSNLSQYIFKIGEQVIFDIVNKGGRSGDINVFQPARNV